MIKYYVTIILANVHRKGLKRNQPNFGERNWNYIKLNIIFMFNKFKADHQSRPIIIMETLKVIENPKQQKENQNTNQYEIVLEKFHEKALEAEKVLIEIAEPSSITKNVQTFIISFYSLYTAMTLDWTEDKII